MKKRQNKQPKQTNMTASAPQKMEAFTFGEPSPVLDRRDILDYVECINNGKWYEPPVNFSGLAKSLRAAVHHSSPIYVKRNILSSNGSLLMQVHQEPRAAPALALAGKRRNIKRMQTHAPDACDA